ncbi:MDR family MFS transporter [Auraticoccus monumenti]|uniref:Drug resistance transporter, EmrB/QacA subfamily n=1 Tax=Auraticoccus monumenti TaxID=675864 RepID=A0A1G6W0U3_9ACTN|nr:MDR family MFS transporter [Auraticoccus monumenti]SDD58847.1 drug resistance transporter, EmrB/QacA subfamily [Auraticoccus monumenti]
MTEQRVSRASVGLRSERGPVLLAVMLSMGLVAIDATILATAVPAIVDDLGGFTQFPWLFSIYLLAQAVSVPVYGKLADVIGRRTVMLVGIGLFVLGSVLCGLAWTMPALIAFRAVQGLGAGAVQPMCMTIIGDIYTVPERATVQGYVASVWAMSSLVGPTLGGLFVDFLDWRWIFFVNVPLGCLAAWVLARRFHEQVSPSRRRIDWPGAALLTVGTSLLVLGLLSGGVEWAWTSTPSLLVLGGSVVVLVVFVLVERRAVEPVLPGWVFTRRVLNGTHLCNLAVGVLLIGLTSYVPVYAQGVLGTSALVAGFALAAMTLGWPLSASQSGRLYMRIGFRDTGLVGSVLALGGTASMLLLDEQSTVLQVAAGCFFVGLGLGLIAAPTLIAAQSTVGWEDRGVVTGAVTFARSMGSAIGIAVFGAVVNARVGTSVGGESGTGSTVPPELLTLAIHDVMVVSTATAVVLVLAVLVLPRRIVTG